MYQSDRYSLADKIAAWEEIIGTMLDCAPLPSGGERCYASTHSLLREAIELQQLKLDVFGKQSCGTSAEGDKRASVMFYRREGRCLGSGWIDLHDRKPFSSLDKCLARIDDTQGLDRCDLYRIERVYVDDFVHYPVFDQTFCSGKFAVLNRGMNPSIRAHPIWFAPWASPVT